MGYGGRGRAGGGNLGRSDGSVGVAGNDRSGPRRGMGDKGAPETGKKRGGQSEGKQAAGSSWLYTFR
jgi:hypothetical protein